MADTSPHATDGISLRGVAVGAAVVGAAIAFSIGAAYVATHFDRTGDTATQSAAHERAPPPIAAPTTLQSDPAADIAAFRDEKRRLLETYGWVDRDRGIVRIPIERAMALIAGRSK